jgi:hypothetical protein
MSFTIRHIYIVTYSEYQARCRNKLTKYVSVSILATSEGDAINQVIKEYKIGLPCISTVTRVNVSKL